MKPKNAGSKALFINSAFAFAAAQLLTAAIHEAGHGLVAQSLGFSPRIYAFLEDNPTGTVQQSLLILAAGPLTSLIVGALFLLWFRSGRAHYSYGRLLLFWLAWTGIMTFVNYLIVTPWLSAGDTAKFADLLHWPLWLRYAVAAIGAVVLVTLGRPAATAMFALAPQNCALETRRERGRYIVRGFYLPLFAGIVLTAPAGIGERPAIVALGLLASLGTIDIVVAALYASGAVTMQREYDAPLRIEPAAIALYGALIVLYVFVFSRGMPI